MNKEPLFDVTERVKLVAESNSPPSSARSPSTVSPHTSQTSSNDTSSVTPYSYPPTRSLLTYSSGVYFLAVSTRACFAASSIMRRRSTSGGWS